MQEEKQDEKVVKALETQSGFTPKRRILFVVLFIIFAVALIGLFFGIKAWKAEGNTGPGENISEEIPMTVYGTLSKDELVLKLKSTIVQIKVEITNADQTQTSMAGSGVILTMTDEYIDIVTASHVVEQTATPKVIFYGGNSVDATVLAYGKESDIAFVRVETSNIKKEVIEVLNEAKRADIDAFTSLSEKDWVIQIGSVSDVAGNVEEGSVLETDRFVELFQNHMLICKSSIAGGMSGGGTFDSEGKLIGVIVGSNGSEAVSVTITDVMAEYRSISL